jgi:hypothetical protein
MKYKKTDDSIATHISKYYIRKMCLVLHLDDLSLYDNIHSILLIHRVLIKIFLVRRKKKEISTVTSSKFERKNVNKDIYIKINRQKRSIVRDMPMIN